MNSINNVSFTSSNKSKKTNNKGALRALVVSQVAPLAVTPVSALAVKGLCASAKSMNESQIIEMNTAIDNVLQSSGLKEKGVKIFNAKPIPNPTNMPDKIWELVCAPYATGKGTNAFYTAKPIDMVTGIVEGNSIAINRQKLPTAAFHELGHAFNYNCSKFWKFMQNMRLPAMAIASSIAIYCALSKKSKPKDGKELNKGQKVNNFIRNNSGKLAFATMLPVVAEEVMASVRGCKWAFQSMPKDLAKKVLKTNVFSAVSYTLAAVGVGLTAYLTTKVKDKINDKANKPK